MKATTASVLLGALSAMVHAAPVVDTVYPYTGPAIPIADWVDPTVNGNGKGYPRLVEPPAVTPASVNPTNNINVISLAYLPTGMNIHYQTPFGLGVAPSVMWGTSPTSLTKQATGLSRTYDRTPPCSLISAVTQCSQWFHEVQLNNLLPGTTYYYQIPAANGTTASEVESFTTARAAGDTAQFTVAVLNDMGYTNAAGTMQQLQLAVEEGIAFTWHGGDISYADDWYSGILPCEDDWPVCYNGTSSELPGGVVDNPDYLIPVPEGEVPSQGGPLGGDMSVLYESNWDLWQQWTNSITTKVPYMVMPGNHEASCAEYDGTQGQLAAYLNDDRANSTAAAPDYLTYYSCPESQRNFTAYMNRFKMPGDEAGGVGNFWYSFDYGLAHFVSIDGETDYAYSPEWPFLRDLKTGESHPTEAETYPNDSGPFGTIDGDNWKVNSGYQQYKWLANDLANVDRTKTPWIIAMSHRPMYSSSTSTYQTEIRAAFQGLMLQYGVDAYLSGHIHWYERMYPLTSTGDVDSASVINQNTYRTNAGVSMTHIINGMAGNIESHSELSGTVKPKTAVLDTTHYGFNKLTFYNATAMKFDFILGKDGSIADELILLKPAVVSSSSTSSSATSTSSSSTKRPCVPRPTTTTDTSSTIGTTSSSSSSATSSVIQTSTSTSATPSSTSSATSSTTITSSSTGNSTLSVLPTSSSTSSATSSSTSVTSSVPGTTSSSASGTTSSSTSVTSSTSSGTSSATSSSTSATSSVPGTTSSSTSGATSSSTSATFSSSVTPSSSSNVVVSSTSETTSSSSIVVTSSMSFYFPNTTMSSTGTPSSSHSSSSTTVASSVSLTTSTSAVVLPGSQTSSIASSFSSTVTSSMSQALSATGLTSSSQTSSIIATTSSLHASSSSISTTSSITKASSSSIITSSAFNPSTSIATTSSISYTSSTVYTTVTSTISSCAPAVTNCPYTTAPIVVTNTIVDYTTYCPVGALSTPVAVNTATAKTTISGVPYTTSTVYKTITSTISSCAATVKNCPFTANPMVVTSVIVDYTTYCPVAGASVPAVIATSPVNKASVSTTPVVGASSPAKVSVVIVATPAAATATSSVGKSTPATTIASTTTTAVATKFTGAASHVGVAFFAGFAGLIGLIAHIL